MILRRPASNHGKGLKSSNLDSQYYGGNDYKGDSDEPISEFCVRAECVT